jgi:hypothetical protein
MYQRIVLFGKKIGCKTGNGIHYIFIIDNKIYHYQL